MLARLQEHCGSVCKNVYPAIPDTSQKVGIRFGQTIKAYANSTELSADDLTAIPLAVAGWCRYLMGIDDDGKIFDVSPDPLLEKLQRNFAGKGLGEKSDVHATLAPILSEVSIWGSNLYDCGVAQKSEKFFADDKPKMSAGLAMSKTLR